MKLQQPSIILQKFYSHLHFGTLREVLLIIQLVNFYERKLLSTANQYSLVDKSETIDGKEVDE